MKPYMSKYSRLFIISSLLYLLFGSILAIIMSIVPGWRPYIHFPHAHTMVIGWISMMIFGLSYHVLPRFASSPLISEKYQRAHWWLANIGMVGMIFVPLYENFFQIHTPSITYFWIFFGILQFLGILIFVKNMLITVRFGPAKYFHVLPCCSSCEGTKNPH